MIAGKVAVVAHDAGAANQILHWFVAGDLDEAQAMFSLHGPALVAARQLSAQKLLTNVKESSLDYAIHNADWVLCGTGWATDLEKQAMAMARAAGTPVIAVLDHWVNYSPRFNHPEQPEVDEIWVVDHEAEVLASSTFPDSRIVRQPGRYLEHQVASVRAQIETCSEHKAGAGQVLFLMEPVRADWSMTESGHRQPGEFAAFDFFLSKLQSSRVHVSHITVRPHPSDTSGKYQSLENEGPREPVISVRSDNSLSDALSCADYVVGLNSYAMVVALASGKSVYCALPPEAPACLLPHDAIVDLRLSSFGV